MNTQWQNTHSVSAQAASLAGVMRACLQVSVRGLAGVYAGSTSYGMSSTNVDTKDFIPHAYGGSDG